MLVYSRTRTVTNREQKPSLILRPGAPPPMLVPYCQLCDSPADKFAMDVVSSPHHVGIHAQCCGVTSSARISTEEMLRVRQTNAKLYVVMRKGQFQGVREQRRR